MKKRVALILLFVVLVAAPLSAVLGIGDIVFDPTSYGEAVLIMGELVQSYEQLKAQLNLQTFLATRVPVDMPSRYRMPTVTWQGLQVPYDRFGNLSAWIDQANQGGAASTAYSNASIELKAYSSLAPLPPDEQRKIASQYASLELADGTNIDSMETIGRLRAKAQAADQALAGLEADSLSADPSLNSEIGVLNKINAATIAQIRAARDANQLMMAALEQQLADSKRRRDADVSETNTQIARLERGAAVKSQYTATVTETLRSFRWQ